MMDEPPPRPPGVARKLDLVELRMGNLRRELEAETDGSVRAAIFYHMGSLYEHELGRQDSALEHYARAHEAMPSFEPTAVARMRIAERDPDSRHTKALSANHVTTASEPAAAAAALLDFALRDESWASLLREAISQSPEPAVPALILEWLAQARRDPDAVRDALRAQAERASDPTLRAALWLDLALAEIDHGEIDTALEALELACDSDQLAWSARVLERRIARQHERWDILVTATVSMARLLEAEAEGSDPLRLPVPEDERLPLAAFLWQEAATHCTHQLGDADAAGDYLAAALRLFPEDRSLRLHALLLAESLGNDDAVSEASDWFRETAPDDPAFVAHEIRAALSRDDDESAVAFLREAAARYPGSDYAQAALDFALLEAEGGAERVERLRQQAGSHEGEARARLIWRAARIATISAPIVDQAQALFMEAASVAAGNEVAILRDAWGAAVHAGHPRDIVARCNDLLDLDLDPDERSLLAFCRYDVTKNLLGDSEGAQRLLRDALHDERDRAWAPHIARVEAAVADDPALLAEAHETLAALTDGDTRVAHLCAAGHAHARGDDWNAAEAALRDALRHAPRDEHVVALLEEVLREGGRPEEVVALARSRAEGGVVAPTGELSLLLAGATAERGGNLTAARQAYEHALRQTPASPASALALADVARGLGDESLRLHAYGMLERSELGGGVPELFALLRGDALGHAAQTAHEGAESHERALGHPNTVLFGAASLLATPCRFTTEEQRSAADEVLNDAGARLSQSNNGFGAAYEALSLALGERASSTGDAWMQLASLAPSEGLRTSALLQGLREIRIDQGERAMDELFMLAHEIEGLATLHPEAAIALDEVLAPGDDPELRAAALQRKLEHSAPMGRGALEAAYCRALVESDKGSDAVALLTQALDERPDDLSLWESLRVAARQAGEWALVAQACERLAPFVEGSLRADLLEEAGAVRLDCLGQHAQAEDAFRSALEEDPSRKIAFRRLHDLLAEREDAEALEALVSARLALGGPKDRPELLYERARLLRGFSDRPGALEVLDELFAAQPDHAGALALAAEVHVSLEQWQKAVDCLRRLAEAGIPDEQRRVAHLGAADFLETHLGAAQEALIELRAVQSLGLADTDTWIRIGALEEQLDNVGAAVEAYQRAVEASPDDRVAVARLAELLQGNEREDVLRRYENAIWAHIDAGELDATLLEGLQEAAHWLGDFDRAMAVAAVRSAIGLEDPTSDGQHDLAHISMAAISDRDANPVIAEVIRRAGPALSKERLRGKKVGPDTTVYAELGAISERLGGRLASVGVSESAAGPTVTLDRDGALQWLVPQSAQAGLDAAGRFRAGRLAWASPRGAGRFLDDSPERLAGTLAAVLQAARCRVIRGGAPLPAVAVRLRRSTRRDVQEAVGDEAFETAQLLAEARRLHRSADRAGLLATGDIGAALRAVLGGAATVSALRSSARGLDLLRFWVASGSPLWRRDA